jgi:hypothetical protein
MALVRIDSSFFLKLGLNRAGVVYSILKGGRLIMLCGDKKIELFANEFQVISSYGEILYPLNTEQLDILRKNKLTDIRIELKDGNLDKIIEEKKSNKIITLAECVDI